MLYAWSKSDAARLAEVVRLTGLGQSADAGAELIDLVNRIWRTNTVPSRFISDSMVAIWSEHSVVHLAMPQLLSEADQFRLLAWYCCARPFESGCRLSREPVDPILHRMAREAVALSPHPALPYSALMMAVYHFRDDVQGAVALRGESPNPSYLGWYYTHGVRELGIIHHVSSEERAVLNTVNGEGADGLSPLCRFALEWQPHPDFDLSSPDDRVQAAAWFTATACQSEPFAALAVDVEIGRAEPPDPRPRSAAKGRGRLAATGHVDGSLLQEPAATPGIGCALGTRHELAWQTVEYFDHGGSGSRLLIAGEWFDAEDLYTFSRVPWASLLFEPPGPISGSVNISILIHAGEDAALLPHRRLTIYLNGAVMWQGTVRDASRGELILSAAPWILHAGAINLLQFHVPEPFVSAEAGVSADDRKLGVALRRLWIAQPGGRRREIDTTAARHPPAQLAESGGKRLLVVRSDLRSQTGYAKATRALAALIPPHFRTIGVDIHPDPADNQAPVPFPIVPAAEALQQVAEHPDRCAVLHATAPDDFSVWPNARNIGWFFWETDAIPHLREWPLRLGLMDAIWAPTTFMAQFVREAGYRGPVNLVAWPDDFACHSGPATETAAAMAVSYLDRFVDRHRLYRQRLLGELRSPTSLLFLAVQSMAPRKGLPLLLREWRAHVAGSGRDDILLLRLAFRHAAGISDDWREVFFDALATAGFCPGEPVRIALMPEALSEDDLGALYRAADAFVSMSYGEGFGGPVLEALRNECPVIAPRHTGLCDLLPETYPLTIASTRLAVALKGNLPAYPHSSTWHIPQPDELCEQLGGFAAMTKEQRRALMQECRKYAMSFCWTPMVRRQLDTVLDQLDLKNQPRPGALERPKPATARPVRHAAD